jgi:hypothetical protein
MAVIYLYIKSAWVRVFRWVQLLLQSLCKELQLLGNQHM